MMGQREKFIGHFLKPSSPWDEVEEKRDINEIFRWIDVDYWDR